MVNLKSIRLNRSIYEVHAGARIFIVEQTTSPGYGTSWQLCELIDGQTEYLNHFITKRSALTAIRDGVAGDN